MKMLLALVLFTGCATSPPVEPLAVPPLPSAAAAECPEVKVPTVSTAASVATRDYRKAEATIGPVVTAPSATADSIHAIDRADKAAQRALRTLVAEDGHPSREAIAAARKALDKLIAALEASKGTP